MRENAAMRMIGKKVELVPYEAEHVAKYHSWLCDAELREATASEPLSLSEEYDMQKSWREDSNKCTFIVLAKSADGQAGSHKDAEAINRMIGDVNLFFNDDEDPYNTEIDIMIAEKDYRRQGCAEEAVQLMMAYATTTLSVTRFYCKIHEKNEASMQLFTQKLGYTQCNYVAAFKEYEFEFVVQRNTKTKEQLAKEIMRDTAIKHDP